MAAPACARGAPRIDDVRLRERQEVADGSDEHVLDLRARQHRLQDVREILQHQYGRGAGVHQLVLEFGRACTADWC